MNYNPLPSPYDEEKELEQMRKGSDFLDFVSAVAAVLLLLVMAVGFNWGAL